MNMRYSDDIIEEVRMKNDIVDVVSQYVKLTRKGSSYFGLCPFHNEKTPSFSVTPSKQMYYCFGCGAGGNVFNFVMEYENYSFGEALSHLADRAGVQLPRIEYSSEAREKAKQRETLLEINRQAAQYFYYQLRRESGQIGYRYLTDRGLSDETIRKFGLGYSDKFSDDLYKFLKGKGYGDDQLRDSGLFNVDERHGMYDKFWNRVIFPIMDVNNRVIGFGGRVMGDGKPKYLNSPETKIFDKSRNLYGLNVARTSRKPYLILCEGYMDVISMHQSGFTNAVASLGTSLTSGHASLLKRYTQEVLLLYDSDEAGVKAALRAIPILREAGINSRVVDLKPHKDPDEFIKTEGAEAFQQRLDQARDSFMFRVSVSEKDFPMEEPQGQNRFFERCARLLLELSDELERNLYIEAIVRQYHRYGISVEDLRKRVNTLAMKGTPIEQRQQPKTVEARQAQKKESAADKAQKLMLTWLVTYPGIFDTVEKYLSPGDFIVPLYHEVAEMLFEQHAQGDVNPARLLNSFTDSEEQREVASLFNATIHLETMEEQERAFSDTLIRIKQESLAEKNKNWDPTDMAGLQELVKAKKELEDLGRKRQQLHISFE
jgi:DNA primase